MNIGQSGPRRPGLELGEALVGHVEGVEPPGTPHQGTQKQGLATSAGAEVHHQFPPSRRQQVAQELAALILHLEGAREEQGVFVEGWLVVQPKGDGGPGSGLHHETLSPKPRLRLLALNLGGIHPQIQRRRAIEGATQAAEGLGAELPFQFFQQPVRHFTAVGKPQLWQRPGLGGAEGVPLTGLEGLVQLAQGQALRGAAK